MEKAIKRLPSAELDTLIRGEIDDESDDQEDNRGSTVVRGVPPAARFGRSLSLPP